MKQTQHTAEYLYLEAALKSRWPTFTALVQEIVEFVPTPLSEAEVEALAAHLGKLNPDKPADDIAKLAREQIEANARPEIQFYRRFHERQSAEFVSVVLLSHALCEALINATIAGGLAEAGTDSLFPLLDRSDFMQKWLTAPKSFAPKYDFPRDGAVYETLKELATIRNKLVHYKINLQQDGKQIYPGTPLLRKHAHQELDWLRRFFSLPYDLQFFLTEALRGEGTYPLMLLFDRRPIPIADAHRKEVGKQPSLEIG